MPPASSLSLLPTARGLPAGPAADAEAPAVPPGVRPRAAVGQGGAVPLPGVGAVRVGVRQLLQGEQLLCFAPYPLPDPCPGATSLHPLFAQTLWLIVRLSSVLPGPGAGVVCARLRNGCPRAAKLRRLLVQVGVQQEAAAAEGGRCHSGALLRAVPVGIQGAHRRTETSGIARASGALCVPYDIVRNVARDVLSLQGQKDALRQAGSSGERLHVFPRHF